MLSNIMPELTEEEVKYMGMYTVSYFDENVNCMVASKYSSIYAFMLKNRFDLEAIDFVTAVFCATDKFEVVTDKGIVGIYR